MITIQRITPAETYPLRHAVLWSNKPLDYVRIDNDADGFHYGAFRDDELVAVISLFVDVETANPGGANPGGASPGGSRFRKFATRPDCQRLGIGTMLLNRVIADARQAGATSLWCDARLDAAEFYRRFGMEAVSDVFYKGAIPYAKFLLIL